MILMALMQFLWPNLKSLPIMLKASCLFVLFSSEKMVLGNQEEVKKNPTAPLRDAKPANSGSDGQKPEQKWREGGSLWPEVQPAEVRKWIRVTLLPFYHLSSTLTPDTPRRGVSTHLLSVRPPGLLTLVHPSMHAPPPRHGSCCQARLNPDDFLTEKVLFFQSNHDSGHQLCLRVNEQPQIGLIKLLSTVFQQKYRLTTFIPKRLAERHWSGKTGNRLMFRTSTLHVASHSQQRLTLNLDSNRPRTVPLTLFSPVISQLFNKNRKTESCVLLVFI